MFFATLALGTIWYSVVEDFGFSDGIFMTVTTISTVGYGEIRPLDTSGRIFTMLYIPLGIGVMAYAAGAIAQNIIIGNVRDALGLQRRSRRIERMHDHVVVCGYGRVGREIAGDLRSRGETVTVIEQSSEALQQALADGLDGLLGDATDEAILREAHVDSARVLIAAADSDASNAFITLTARAVNPTVLIVARAGSESGAQRLTAAGANRVVSPYLMAGRRMALAAVQPLMTDFLDSYSRRGPARGRTLAALVVADEFASLAGQPLAEACVELRTARVLGIERADGALLVGPAAETLLAAGDRLVFYGPADELESLFADHGPRNVRP